MKRIYLIIISVIVIVGVIAGVMIKWCFSDAISFYLGLAALFVAIVSLSIADRRITQLDYSLEVWWERNQNDWYEVKFKLVNQLKKSVDNTNLLISLPRSTALLDNALQKHQFQQLLADNRRIYQSDILKFFPAKGFEFIVEIKLELPHWKDDDIVFVMTSEKYKYKEIQLTSKDVKKIIKSNLKSNALILT